MKMPGSSCRVPCGRAARRDGFAHARRGVRNRVGAGRAYAGAWLLGAWLVLPAHAHAQERLRVGIYDNCPKIYSASNGVASGFFPAVLDLVARPAGWTLEYVPGTWDECLERLERGDLDIMPDVAYSQPRAERYLFTEETALISYSAIYTRPDLEVQSFFDLSDQRIAVLINSINYTGPDGIRSILDKFQIPAAYVECTSYDQVLQAVQTGRADAAVVNNIFGATAEGRYRLLRSPLVFNPSQLKFALSRKAPQAPTWARHIDAALRELKANRTSQYYQALDTHIYGMAPPAPAAGEDTNTSSVLLTPAESDWIAQHPVIRLGFDPEFVPFEFADDRGQYAGLASDYVRLLNKMLGLNMQVVSNQAWKAAVEQIKRGDLDVLPCVGETEERRGYLRFSKAYVNYHRVILTRNGAPFVAGIDDIRDWRVGVQTNTSHSGFLRDRTTIQPTFYPTLQDSLLALSAGRVDAVVGNLASAAFWIRKLNLANLKVAAPASYEVSTLHFAVRKDWPELVAILNKGLDAISDQVEQDIRRRWVGIEFKPGIQARVVWGYVWRVGLVLVPLLVLILVWNYQLKRQIRRRVATEKQLQHQQAFARQVSEISAHLMAATPEAIDAEVAAGLAAVTHLAGADAGFLLELPGDPAPLQCLQSCAAGPAGGGPEALAALHTPWWRDQLRAGRPILLAGPGDLPASAGVGPAELAAAGVGSLVEAPCGGKDGRCTCLCLTHRAPGRNWSQDDVSLLRLLGQNITNALARKKAEESLAQYAHTLEQANRQLTDLDRLKNMFIASVSHELRTPLNSIIGFTGVLLKGMTGPLNPRQQEQLGRVYKSAHHLLELITDIIDISKIESGRIDLFPTAFPLADALREAVASIQPQLETKGLAMEVGPLPACELFTDRKRFQQCVLNYLSNAVKYTERGRVSLAARETEGQVEITVTDTGIGIAPADMERLYEAFERFDSHLRIKAGGTGLGLYLTKKIVTELLKGRVFARSTPGTGSVFGLAIPRDVRTVQAPPAAGGTP